MIKQRDLYVIERRVDTKYTEGYTWYTVTKYKQCKKTLFKKQLSDPEYTRLYNYPRGHDDKKLIDWCITADNLLSGKSTPFKNLSPHVQELFIKLIYQYSKRPLGRGEYIGTRYPPFNPWFNGLNVEEFLKELRQVLSCFKDEKYKRVSYNNEHKIYRWDKYAFTLNIMQFVRKDGSQAYYEDLPNIWAEVRHFEAAKTSLLAIDWKDSEIDPTSFIEGKVPEFPTRNEPLPYFERYIDDEDTRSFYPKEGDVPHIAPQPAEQYPVWYEKEFIKHTPRCPTCQSPNIEKISTANKMLSVGTLGLASSKIGKQFKCKECGYMW